MTDFFYSPENRAADEITCKYATARQVTVYNIIGDTRFVFRIGNARTQTHTKNM